MRMEIPLKDESWRQVRFFHLGCWFDKNGHIHKLFKFP